MDLRMIKEYMAVADAGSFKEAARALGMPKSVLSSHIKMLEKSFNAVLLRRSSRSVSMTGAGRLLYNESAGLLSMYRRLENGLSDMRGHTYRSLGIQLCAQTMPADLGPYLDIYSRKHPRLFVNLYDENTCAIREGLFSGKTDIVFAIGREDDFFDIPGRKILYHFPNMHAVLPFDHRYASLSSVSFDMLSGETFVIYPRMKEEATHDLQLSILKQAGIPYSIYEDDSSPFYYDLLVPIGKGIRLWNWRDAMTPNTSLVTISDPGYDTYFFMLYMPESDNATMHDFVKEFISFRESRT